LPVKEAGPETRVTVSGNPLLEVTVNVALSPNYMVGMVPQSITCACRNNTDKALLWYDSLNVGLNATTRTVAGSAMVKGSP
jgi:hypothetical protein